MNYWQECIVREQLQEQVRASGMLGGPDFSDPDEALPLNNLALPFMV